MERHEGEAQDIERWEDEAGLLTRGADQSFRRAVLQEDMALRGWSSGRVGLQEGRVLFKALFSPPPWTTDWLKLRHKRVFYGVSLLASQTLNLWIKHNLRIQFLSLLIGIEGNGQQEPWCSSHNAIVRPGWWQAMMIPIYRGLSGHQT